MIKLCNLSFLFILLFFCCKKPYNPSVISSPDSYLVVEGVINLGNDSTIITLSKTVNVNAKKTANPVLGATVTIQSDQNERWSLYADGTGRYTSPALNLSASQKYRLSINTSDGQQYLSDFVAVKPTPAIDSIGYVIQNGGLQLYVNAHDPTSSTKYYRWDYYETWMFHSKYGSSYVADTINQTIVLRRPDQQIYSCFGNDVSTSILLTSTTNLSNDIIYQYPLTNIDLTSEKLEEKYSILVKQYALSEEAYQYYFLLKKNTEQLGTIFDPQPSVLTGNIHCVTNVNKIVIGYITATNVQSKRIFIPNSALPNTLTIYPSSCEVDTAGNEQIISILIKPPYTDVPIGLALKGGYSYSSKECVDCTIRGATKTPAFWK